MKYSRKLIKHKIKKSISALPETGGMGTKIFYIAGAALIAGAGITLFVRKRVSDEKQFPKIQIRLKIFTGTYVF